MRAAKDGVARRCSRNCAGVAGVPPLLEVFFFLSSLDLNLKLCLK